jgi:hypothetical protein
VYTGFWWRKLRERGHLEGLGLDRKIILRWILRKWLGGAWTGLIWFRIMNLRGSIKCGEFLPCQEGLCSVEQKGKGLPQQAEETQGVPVRLGPRIFLTFGTTRVVDRQPYAPPTFTPGEIPGTHF